MLPNAFIVWNWKKIQSKEFILRTKNRALLQGMKNKNKKM
jgi:hypothetical protein